MEPKSAGWQAANETAAEALRLCIAGETTQGLSLYRQALATDAGGALDVGLHAQLLSGSGLHSEADAIRQSGLRAGADLSSCALSRGGDHRRAADEYRRLFADGVVNARMIANYVNCVSHLNDGDEVARLMCPDSLFTHGPIAASMPASISLSRIVALIQDHPARRLETRTRSFRGVQRLPETHRIEDPDLAALHRIVLHAVEDYIRRLQQIGHPLGDWCPPRLALASWAGLAEGGGHSAPHIHGNAWVAAVVYLAGESGALCVGPAGAGNADCAGWPQIRLSPTPGTLVVMPAFYTHWTEEPSAGDVRIAIAFNAFDASLVES